MSNKNEVTKKIKHIAKEMGFHLVFITEAKPPTYFSSYLQWIEKNYHGEMEYLKRHVEKKADPKHVLSSAKSIICCGVSYKTSFHNPLQAQKGHALISNYAWGDDYHLVIEKMLIKLLNKIKELIPEVEAKYYVDTGPLLERNFAAMAGLGWIGKNTCLINQTYGSYIFLSELLVNIELEEDFPELDHCGTCMKCLESCPTGAFVAPYQLDAKKCISYLTIEKRGEFNLEEKGMIGDHLFGCDICQQVCPWNDKSETPDMACFRPREKNFHPDLESFSKITEGDFHSRFQKSPMKRTKYEGFKRNFNVVWRSEV